MEGKLHAASQTLQIQGKVFVRRTNVQGSRGQAPTVSSSLGGTRQGQMAPDDA